MVRVEDDSKVCEERNIPIGIFEGKTFVGTISVRLVTYADGTARLFDERGELVAIGIGKDKPNGN